MQKEIFSPQGKILCHLERVNRWIQGENVGPILVEINPINICNHKCYWCYCQHFHKREYLDLKVLFDFMKDFKDLGGKAINWTGGGEPTLYPHIKDIITNVYELGIEQGMFTNGDTLTEELQDLIVRKLRWIRISIDASTSKTYEIMHGVKTYEKIINNVKNMVKLRNNLGFDKSYKNDGQRMTIGVCMSINQDNYHELYELCRNCKNWGVDYFQVRPTLNLPKKLQMSYEFWKKFISPEIEKCYELEKWRSKNNFRFMYTRYKFEELIVPEERTYTKCYGAQFVPVLDANGDIVNCMYFLGNKDYVLGNLYKSGFKKIWKSNWQKKMENLDLSKCQVACKNNEINKFLYVVRHQPFIHKNFL